MGYYIFSYGINSNRVKAAIGSKDSALYNEILTTKTFALYSGQDFKDHTTTREALEHLIFGKPYNNRSAHAYWYAFTALCAHLGKSFPSTHEIKLGYETDLINEYMESDFGVPMAIEEVLINQKNPFGLPPVTDFPMSGLLNGSELLELQLKFSTIDITGDMLEQLLDEDEEKEMAYDSIKQTKENITYCINNDLELISFCH